MSQSVVQFRGTIYNDAFYFSPVVNGYQVPNVILDTGAFELTFSAQVAQDLGLPKLGKMQIGGVGGTAEAYQSRCDLTIGNETYLRVPCIIDPSFQSAGLFGLRFFVDNQLQLSLNSKTQTLTISKA